MHAQRLYKKREIKAGSRDLTSDVGGQVVLKHHTALKS